MTVKTVKLYESAAGQTLLDIRAALVYNEQAQERTEARRKIMTCRGRAGGRATAAKREMARLASIGIAPIPGR